MTNPQVRVRFAPSPTGPLHLGGIRTALYNYLFARKHKGQFVLRIEDTDQNRFVPGAEEYIIRSLKWCGLHVDEGIEQNGPYAPYRQSERTEIYREHIRTLVDRGHAYYAFDTPGELESLRSEEPGGQFQYNCRTRLKMRNSLTLPKEESEKMIASGVPYVIRIRIPEDEVVVFHDLIRGEVRVKSDNLDDKVLFKSDGFPTYHLANVVDDYLMRITHVIRGEEWLPSAPMHLLLYRFFGWESSMPKFAHLPLILKPDGNGKLSKRDGDRLGFPVFPLEWKDPVTGEISRGYREDGYLPEAFINILALLGWNPGSDQEIFSLQKLIDLFSIERIGHSGSKFDPEKARWFNHQYLLSKSSSELVPFLEPLLEKNKISADKDYLIRVIDLIKERVVLVPDLWNQSWFLFSHPTEFDEQMKKKAWRPETEQLVRDFISGLNLLQDFSSDSLHNYIQEFTARMQVKTGALMSPLRLLIVGSGQGPGIIDIALLLGKEEFLSRIDKGLEKITGK